MRWLLAWFGVLLAVVTFNTRAALAQDDPKTDKKEAEPKDAHPEKKDGGLKHLNELLGVVRAGGRALMLFVAVRAITSRTTRREMAAARVIPVDLTPP